MRNLRFLGACLALLLAIVPVAASAAETGDDILPFKATTTTLPNGLVVIVVPTGFPNIVSVQIPVLTGSRNEVEPGKSGFAHFFEHMMFRGTPTLSPEAYNAIVTKAGARQNAYTTDDYTNYHVTFAKEDLETMLKIEADRFQNLSYPVEAFKTEANAVLGEYNKNSANPIQKLYETMRAKAFTTHTYRHTTMGFIEDIEDMPNQYEYSKTFFSRWYRPENAAIIVAGDVDPAKVLPLVEKYWGGWKPGSGETVAIPQEPAPKGSIYAHVPWATPTAPWVAVAFRGPAFSETAKDAAAIDLFVDINFGRTSDVYRKLVEQEQKVDQFFAGGSDNVDPELITIFARVKKQEDALYVRDEILRAVAATRAAGIDAKRLEEAKSNARYSFTARLDNTDTIAGTLARFVRYRRSYDTLNNVFRVYASLTPEDLDAAAKKYFVDESLVVTTLAKDALPAGIETLPSLATFSPSQVALDAKQIIVQKSELPQLRIKLLFDIGSAYDPKGKEGLARLTASMIADAGSKAMRIDEINKALYPIAGSLGAQVDKEMTTFTMSVHRDNWERFSSVALPQLLEPGFRQEDFDRLKTNQLNSLTIDLRSNNEEELGKEWLQNRIFEGTPYGHAVLGTVEGIGSITLGDVKAFAKQHYTTGNLKVGINGGVTDAVMSSLQSELGKLPAGVTPRVTGIAGKPPKGHNVDIVAKDTRATAISFGHPIDVNRASADFAALDVARAWLGEHRASMSHLYDRIRETRGMNYGDYAYIEAFPRGMYQFFPDPNIGRQKQIFEVWIRPVVPENGHMALRIALYEVDKLVKNGMTKAQFEMARDYLMKNVYVKTSTSNQQIGYALDSEWYGIGEYSAHMRAALAKLTLADVNKAIRKHIHPKDMKIVMITKDAEGLMKKLVTDEISTIKYEGEKPKALLDEDKVIGAMKLGIRSEQVNIIPVEDVFRK
ncbi:MAG: insulinase family protein [Thermoanaerobaculia bacterium]|nr:insulinase family protein [Thermoanaerobaculia bacterium]